MIFFPESVSLVHGIIDRRCSFTSLLLGPSCLRPFGPEREREYFLEKNRAERDRVASEDWTGLDLLMINIMKF